MRTHSVLTALVVVLTAACQATQRPNDRVAPVSDTGSQQTQSDQRAAQTGDKTGHSSVIRIVSITDKMLHLSLENHDSRPIYVIYEPGKGNAADFIVYTLQRREKRDSEFKRYGPVLHFVPGMHPVEPGTAISDELPVDTLEDGEYRIQVGYWDDEELYKVYLQKWPDFTEGELNHMRETGKLLFSDTFIIARNNR